jgi:diketogulonate reductase-like aldo/keto reductase
LGALKGAAPVVNQCEMSVMGVDKGTLAYCQAHNIVYESFGAMRGW